MGHPGRNYGAWAIVCIFWLSELRLYYNICLSAIAGVTAALLALSTTNLITELDTTTYAFTCLIYIQKVDTKFGSIDLNSKTQVRNYFYELCTIVPDYPRSVVDKFFDEIDIVLRSNSPESLQLHEIMQKCAEEIHDLLAKIRAEEDNALQIAVHTLHVMDRSILDVGDVIQDYHGGEDEEKTTFGFIKDSKAKDLANKEADYDSIG